MIFFQKIKRTLILKPLSGSGSELVFKCQDAEEIKKAVGILRKQLFKRLANPFFTDIKCEAEIDPCQTWITEEFIRGPEYSCDFILNQGKVTLVRETGKIKAPDQTFGTVLAYTCPPIYPKGFSYEHLYEILGKATDALGFSHGYFMTDFIVNNGKVYIIEMTPRPGGDSIPDLIKTASGYDILNGYLEFMCENTTTKRPLLPLKVNACAGVNFYADRAGVISQLNYSELLSDPRVKNVIFKKQPGDRVVLPPENYDDRLLGYCIVALNSSRLHHSQYRSLQRRLKVSITN
jgi:biotin carboxylase